jgi:hypothetical protein
VRRLLAEIHNKISQTGSNLSDRLEDKLTGDFFGAIRYLPFETGLNHVLSTVDVSMMNNRDKWLKYIAEMNGYILEFEFWKREEEGEIDLFLSSEEVIIGIEVKYLSGLSSEDEDGLDTIDYTESVNQLARYSRMLEKLSDGRDAYLILLAPYQMMDTVRKNMIAQPVFSPAVNLGFLSWEDILESLKTINLALLEKGEQLIIQDLQALLTKKGLTRFYGFNEDIFNQPIFKESYTFTCENNVEKHLNWPTKQIRKDESYVYNIG